MHTSGFRSSRARQKFSLANARCQSQARMQRMLADTVFQRRLSRSVTVAMVALAILALVLPRFAFAQDVDNPFADDAARDGAVSVIKSLKFWMFIAGALGLVLYIIAFFLQVIIPDWFQQMRGFVQKGALFLAGGGFVLTLILQAAEAARNQ